MLEVGAPCPRRVDQPIGGCAISELQQRPFEAEPIVQRDAVLEPAACGARPPGQALGT